VIPILTPAQMGEVDRHAREPVEILIERAGFAVARAARRMLAGAYGHRVVVVTGRGNNGADGRAAAQVLARQGTAVVLLDAADDGVDEGLAAAAPHLVIDAAYGTGLSRPYAPPNPAGAPVLAVDIPSGLSGLTGQPIGDAAVRAARTVTFAALKPGLLVGDGPEHAGGVEVVDIGLGSLVADAASTWLVEDSDVVRDWPARRPHAHKWQSAVQIVAGSPDMYGAPWLVSRGALRAGAGYARVGVPGAPPGGGLPPGEQVTYRLPAHDWDQDVVALGLDRVRALVVGPGLGAGTGAEEGPGPAVARLLSAAPVPAVVDADGLRAFSSPEAAAAVVTNRAAATIFTPHEGEYARLVGRPPAEDRIADVRAVAQQTGAVVLLKGSPTVVAAPDGRVLVVSAGSARLATAGTGDVLSGAIGAFLARGLPALEAAAYAAHCHGRAAGLGPAEGLVASDLPDLMSRWLSEVVG
jgi:NAD(P)H-hydrate epimerase